MELIINHIHNLVCEIKRLTEFLTTQITQLKDFNFTMEVVFNRLHEVG